MNSQPVAALTSVARRQKRKPPHMGFWAPRSWGEFVFICVAMPLALPLFAMGAGLQLTHQIPFPDDCC